jgi:hypothetical protein
MMIVAKLITITFKGSVLCFKYIPFTLHDYWSFKCDLRKIYLITAALDAGVPIICRSEIVVTIDGIPNETLPFAAAIFWFCSNFLDYFSFRCSWKPPSLEYLWTLFISKERTAFNRGIYCIGLYATALMFVALLQPFLTPSTLSTWSVTALKLQTIHEPWVEIRRAIHIEENKWEAGFYL